MKELEEERVCVKFYLKLANTITETIQILKQDAERGREKKGTEGWTNTTWILHHDKSPGHTSPLVREDLAKHGTTVCRPPNKQQTP
jgi:hypothetical protein